MASPVFSLVYPLPWRPAVARLRSGDLIRWACWEPELDFPPCHCLSLPSLVPLSSLAFILTSKRREAGSRTGLWWSFARAETEARHKGMHPALGRQRAVRGLLEVRGLNLLWGLHHIAQLCLQTNECNEWMNDQVRRGRGGGAATEV